MDNKKDDSYNAKKALDNLFAIKKYLGDKSYSDFVLNDELVDAVMFRLIQLIENIKGISKEFKILILWFRGAKLWGFEMVSYTNMAKRIIRLFMKL